MSKSNTIESRSSLNDSDEFSCVDLYAVVEGRARQNSQRAVVGKVIGKDELASRVETERFQRVAGHDTEQIKLFRAQALEQRSGRRLEQVQPATYPSIEKLKDKDKAVSVKVTSCNDKIESSDKPRFKPSCSSSQSMISHRSPAPAPRRKHHDNLIRSPCPAPTSKRRATPTAAVGAKLSAEHENTRARLRNSIDKGSIAFLSDLHQSPSPARRSRHTTSNGDIAYVGAETPAEHRRARRKSSIDNGSVGLRPERHHNTSPAPRSRRATSSVPTASVGAQISADRTRARRRYSGDNGSIAFLPDLNQRPSPAPRSRLDTKNEPTAYVSTRVPAKGTPARRKNSIVNGSTTVQPLLVGSSPSPRFKPSIHSIDGSGSQSVEPQSYCRSKAFKGGTFKHSLS